MKRRSAAIAAVLALAAGLSACATATPYQPNVPGAPVSGAVRLSSPQARFFRNRRGVFIIESAAGLEEHEEACDSVHRVDVLVM